MIGRWKILLGGVMVALALASGSGAQQRGHGEGYRGGGGGHGGYAAPRMAGAYRGGQARYAAPAYGYGPRAAAGRYRPPSVLYPPRGYVGGAYGGPRGYIVGGRRPNSLAEGWGMQQEEARSGVRHGQMAPLSRVIEDISRRTPGRQLDTGIEYEGGRPIYRVRWMTVHGRRMDIFVDAATGAILGQR